MRNRITRAVVTALLAVVFMFGPARPAQARTYEDLYTYYNETWTSVYGWRYFFCDDSLDWWGNLSSAREWTRTNCSTFEETRRCQIYYGGTWYDVECPI